MYQNKKTTKIYIKKNIKFSQEKKNKTQVETMNIENDQNITGIRVLLLSFFVFLLLLGPFETFFFFNFFLLKKTFWH